MEIFFSGKDLDRLYEILADDLEFNGPLATFDSAHDYISSVKADPPVLCKFRLLKTFEEGSFVNLVYEFSKPGLLTEMSQLFEVHEGKITRVKLIFDTAQFSESTK